MKCETYRVTVRKYYRRNDRKYNKQIIFSLVSNVITNNRVENVSQEKINNNYYFYYLWKQKVAFSHGHTVLANVISEVCNDVTTEPALQEVTGEILHRSANVQNEARLDIAARSFWERGQRAFFDVRGF